MEEEEEVVVSVFLEGPRPIVPYLVRIYGLGYIEFYHYIIDVAKKL